jgi:23S rRNA (uracil1939-C5)-methyltransferase
MPDVTQAREQKCYHAINPMAEPNMDSSNWCGGCKWQFVQYDFQRKIKSDIIQDSFKADFDLVKGVWSWEVLATPNEYSWRNKIEFSFWKYIVSNKNDEKWFLIREDWNLWFHRQWQFSKVIDVDQCRYHSR